MLNEIFMYTYMQRALIVGLLVSVCSALLGINLVLKRYSMIGDGLSHVAFGALSIAVVMNVAPLYIALPTVIVAAFLLLKLGENKSLQGDSIIALVSSSAMAIGVIATSFGKINIDVSSYMFGSILALTKQDVLIAITMAIIVIGMYIVFYNKIFMITFDEDFAKATGVKTNLYNMLLAILTALTVVIGMKIMGTLLISSLIIFPALTSMRVSRKYKNIIILSLIVSCVCFISGLSISYLFDLPTAATIVLTNLVMFILFIIYNKLKTS